MINLSCHLDKDFGRTRVYALKTSRCFYSVAVGEQDVHVIGPGVEATYTRGDEVPADLTSEGTAACAVLVWEEGA